VDDRQNWINMVKSRDSSGKKQQRKQAINSNTAKRHKEALEIEEDKEDDDEIDNERSVMGDLFIPNKFDPRFFKTVSQILNDFESLQPANHLNQAHKFAKTNKKVDKQLNKEIDTSIKILNKLQSKADRVAAQG